MSPMFTLLHPDGRADVPASTDGDRVRIAPEDLRDALGWELKPQGLCKDDRCIPLPSSAAGDGLDLATLADLLGRPLALDLAERAACLGVAAAERARDLTSLDAPDFTLPDLDGRAHSLAGFRGKKILLVAFASW